MSPNDIEFKNIKTQLHQILPEIETFIRDLKEKTSPDNYLIYDFQKLMDSLMRIKDNADKATRTLDHG